MYPDTSARPETVTFLDTTYQLMGGFRRYYLSQSTSNKGRKKAKGLHVAVWEHSRGVPAPKGFHCHHIDGDSFNNLPDNLEMVDPKEHRAHHREHKKPVSQKQLAHLDRVRGMTKAWHASPEGIAWHRQNSIEVAAKWVETVVQCEVCGKDMKTRGPRVRRYCDSYCNFKALRSTGKWDRQVWCSHCGKQFTGQPSPKMQYPATCSRPCRRHARGKGWAPQFEPPVKSR